MVVQNFLISNMFVFLAAGIFSALSLNILASSEGLIKSSETSYSQTVLRSQRQASSYFKVVHDDNVTLVMDQALLKVCSRVGDKVRLYAQSSVCYECPLLDITDVASYKNVSLVVDSRFISHIVVQNLNFDNSCSHKEQFVQYGRYMMWVSLTNASLTCNTYLDNEPFQPDIPIYIAIAIFVALAIIWISIKCLFRRGYFAKFPCVESNDMDHLINSDLGRPASGEVSERSVSTEVDVPVRATRLRSLDTFRGISLAVMIFVNYGGGGYWFFKHSAWNGLTVADLVFPWFVFIMGTSMALAFRSALRRGMSRFKLVIKVLRRTVILFMLGLLVSNSAKHGRVVNLETLRIPGVLQRLALTYMVVGLMEALFTKTHDTHQHKWWAPVRDLLPYSVEWFIMLCLVTLHCCIIFLLPVPDCDSGYLGPGGLDKNGTFENCTGGATGYVDRLILGDNHIYRHPTCTIPYQCTQHFDPEGILGILTSALICFLGLQAGKIIIIYQDWVMRMKRWVIWGLLCGIVAGALCHFSKEGGWIPINKNLWSLSFVLALSSMAFILLTICYLLVDVYHVWSGSPFFYTGMNSIVIYMGHEVLRGFFPVQFQVSNTHAAQLAMNLWGTCLWIAISIILYYKKIFVAI